MFSYIYIYNWYNVHTDTTWSNVNVHTIYTSDMMCIIPILGFWNCSTIAYWKVICSAQRFITSPSMLKPQDRHQLKKDSAFFFFGGFNQGARKIVSKIWKYIQMTDLLFEDYRLKGLERMQMPMFLLPFWSDFDVISRGNVQSYCKPSQELLGVQNVQPCHLPPFWMFFKPVLNNGSSWCRISCHERYGFWFNQ